ncbi:MAG: NTP transferase domain-containing protein [Euryarchaeota archaeon]|nr:NTP transferase domain-containing protein [Euryarchaeota archaeon]
MEALILAAGRGTRLEPLTETQAKCMLPLGGKPVLEHIVEALVAEGIGDITILVGHLGRQIMEHFGDGGRFGARISYLTQEERLGTAHAVGQASFDDDFLVLNGDAVLPREAIRAVADAHEGSSATLGLLEVEEPSLYGIVELEGALVKGITEKPEDPKSNLANAGVYAFSPDIFHAIERTGKSPRGEYEITDSISLLIEEGRTVKGVTVQGPLLDIGTPWTYLDSNQAVLDSMEMEVLGMVEDFVAIKGELHLGEGSVIRSGTYIEGPVYIGRNSAVGPNAHLRSYATIGDNCRVGGGVEIKNSIVMDGTSIPHLSYLGDSVVGRGCNFGAGAKVGNLRLDSANVKMRLKGELVDSGRRKLGTVIGDNVKLGLNVMINSGRKIGSNTMIGPGVVVDRDVPRDSFMVLKQDLVER